MKMSSKEIKESNCFTKDNAFMKCMTITNTDACTILIKSTNHKLHQSNISSATISDSCERPF